MEKIKYYVTRHAMQRMKERFSDFYNTVPEMKTWYPEAGMSKAKKVFDILLSEGQENRSYLNNTVYMIGLYERYGYDTEYKFIEIKEAEMLLVFTKNTQSEQFALATIMPPGYHPDMKNTRDTGKPKKNTKYHQFLMNWNEKYNAKPKKKVEEIVEPLALYQEPAEDLKESFLKEIKQHKTQIVGEPSPGLTTHKTTIDEIEYVFDYSNRFNVPKIIITQKTDLKEVARKEFQKLINTNVRVPIATKAALMQKIRTNKVKKVADVSEHEVLYVALIENEDYTFSYIQKENYIDVIVRKIDVLQADLKVAAALSGKVESNTVSIEVSEELIALIQNKNVKLLENVSNKTTKYKTFYNDKEYTFNHTKRASGDRFIEILDVCEPVPEELAKHKEKLQAKKDLEELQKSLTPELKSMLIEKVHNNDREITFMEKVSNSKSLYKANLDDAYYEFVYLRSASFQKDIILMKKEPPRNNAQRLKM